MRHTQRVRHALIVQHHRAARRRQRVQRRVGHGAGVFGVAVKQRQGGGMGLPASPGQGLELGAHALRSAALAVQQAGFGNEQDGGHNKHSG
jgi:hypothetical protein